MAVFTKLSVSGVNWEIYGGAPTLLDAVAVTGDGKSAGYPSNPGAAPMEYLQFNLAPLGENPDTVTVSGRFSGVVNYVTVPLVELYDGARKIFAVNPYLTAAIGDFTIDLVKQYSGPVDSSVDWVLLFYVGLDPGIGGVSVDLLEASYHSGGSGGGTGPGGQRSQNASILIPTMVQP